MGKKLTVEELESRFKERDLEIYKEREIIYAAKARELKLRRKQYRDKSRIKKLMAESTIALEGFADDTKIVIKDVHFLGNDFELWCCMSNKNFDGYLEVRFDKDVSLKDISEGKTKLVHKADHGIVNTATLQLVDIGELTLKEV